MRRGSEKRVGAKNGSRPTNGEIYMLLYPALRVEIENFWLVAAGQKQTVIMR
jgi:hypothetical protein